MKKNSRSLVRTYKVLDCQHPAYHEHINVPAVDEVMLEFFAFFFQYFPAKRDRWCVEQQNQTKIGDIVIMKNLPHAVDKDVFTKVNEVLYSVGNIKDPITGRLCRGTEFIDEEQRAQEVGRRQVEQMTQKRTIIE